MKTILQRNNMKTFMQIKSSPLLICLSSSNTILQGNVKIIMLIRTMKKATDAVKKGVETSAKGSEALSNVTTPTSSVSTTKAPTFKNQSPTRDTPSIQPEDAPSTSKQKFPQGLSKEKPSIAQQYAHLPPNKPKQIKEKPTLISNTTSYTKPKVEPVLTNTARVTNQQVSDTPNKIIETSGVITGASIYNPNAVGVHPSIKAIRRSPSPERVEKISEETLPADYISVPEDLSFMPTPPAPPPLPLAIPPSSASHAPLPKPLSSPEFKNELQAKVASKELKYNNDVEIGFPSAMDMLEAEQQEQFANKIKQNKENFLKQQQVLLEEYKTIKGDKQQEKIFYKKLQDFELQSHSYIPKDKTRNDVEFYNLFPKGSEPKNEVEVVLKEFLLKKTTNTLLSLEERKEELNLYKEGLHLLLNYGDNLDEKQFFEVIRRLKIVKNNDAIFSGDESYNKQVVIEGEGFSLQSNVYEFIAKNPPSFVVTEEFRIEQSQADEIFRNLDNNMYSVYISEYTVDNVNPNQNKLVESSDEIHMNVVTFFTDTSGKKIPVSLGHYTSNTDKSTVHIAPKQYVNKDPNTQIKNKEQRFRPYLQLVLVPEEKVKEYNEATVFSKITNLEGINIRKNLLDSIKEKEASLRQSPVRPYYNFTKENMKEITIKILQQQLEEKRIALTMGEKKYKNLSQDEQITKTQRMINQRTNEENDKKRAEVVRKLSPEYNKMKQDLRKSKHDN